MKRVYKYTLARTASNLRDDVVLELPKGAQPLRVDMQDHAIVMWALVDPDAPITRRHFRIAGTGHPIEDEGMTYIGTFFMLNGSLVFHVFEFSP